MLRNGQVSPQMEIQGNMYCISFAEDKTDGKMPRDKKELKTAATENRGHVLT